jgi:hypothetical protein
MTKEEIINEIKNLLNGIEFDLYSDDIILLDSTNKLNICIEIYSFDECCVNCRLRIKDGYECFPTIKLSYYLLDLDILEKLLELVKECEQ